MSRRSNKPPGRSATKKPDEKTLPEVFIGWLDEKEAWARDNGQQRLRLYGKDEREKGQPWDLGFKKVPMFQSATNPNLEDDEGRTIRLYILNLLQETLASAPTGQALHNTSINATTPPTEPTSAQRSLSTAQQPKQTSASADAEASSALRHSPPAEPTSAQRSLSTAEPTVPEDPEAGDSRGDSGDMIDHATSGSMDNVEESRRIGIRTILRVSTSDKPARAPINVLFGNCRDVDELFHKVLSECSVSRNLASLVRELSAEFTWSGRRNLIRKGNNNDWSFFYEDLQRSWERDVNRFTDSQCEIEIMVHLET